MPDIPAPAATAARALLASLVRHALVAAGAALVTRGLVDQGQVDGIIPTLVESIVGTLLVAGATGWAQVRAWLAHGRFAAAWAVLNAAVPPPGRTAVGLNGDLIPVPEVAAARADTIKAPLPAGIPDTPDVRATLRVALASPSTAAAGQADSAGPVA